jgi:small subunit ribosomal protein S17
MTGALTGRGLITVEEQQTQEAPTRGRRKTRQGRVVSDKMDKTVVVSIESRQRHPLYGRIVRRTTRFKAHDEENQFQVGDLVEITECRPISADKRWRVSRLIEKAK